MAVAQQDLNAFLIDSQRSLKRALPDQLEGGLNVMANTSRV